MALADLHALNLSWFGCTGCTLPAGPVAALDQITLVTIDKKPFFSARPPTSFLAFFPGLWKGYDPDFSKNVYEVQQRFAQLPATYTPGEKEALQDLQRRINLLGRYIFVERATCVNSLLRTERLASFEVRYFTPTTLPAPATVKTGLKNLNSTMCWLNATIIYLTATSYYDKFLTEPIENPVFEALRASFCRLIHALRLNENSVVVDDLHREVVEQMKESKFCDLLKDQQDASEFLVLLQQNFAHKRPQNELVQCVTLFESTDSTISKPLHMDQPSLRSVIVPPESGEVDIAACMQEPGSVEGVTSYVIEQDDTVLAVESGDPRAFSTREVFVHLPDQLEVLIRKRHQISLREGFSAVVCKQKLKLGPIALFEHEMCGSHTTRPKTRCTYRIKASIEQRGETASSGHYVANIRTANGISSYSDSDVVHEQGESCFERSYLVLLECQERTAVEVEPGLKPLPDPSPPVAPDLNLPQTNTDAPTAKEDISAQLQAESIAPQAQIESTPQTIVQAP